MRHTDDLCTKEVVARWNTLRDHSSSFSTSLEETGYTPDTIGIQTVLGDLEPLEAGNGRLRRIGNLCKIH